MTADAAMFVQRPGPGGIGELAASELGAMMHLRMIPLSAHWHIINHMFWLFSIRASSLELSVGQHESILETNARNV